MYDGWNLIAELVTPVGGAETGTTYVWGLDLSQRLQGAGGIGGLLLQDTGTATRLYTYEANGNVGQLVDGTTGAVVAHYEYDPFGTTLTASGTAAAANPFRFSTKYTDTETDLLYYGYRFYSPYLGRWLTRDPIDEDGGLNLYSFVWNNPIVFFDLIGLQIEEYLPNIYIDPTTGKLEIPIDGTESFSNSMLYMLRDARTPDGVLYLSGNLLKKLTEDPAMNHVRKNASSKIVTELFNSLDNCCDNVVNFNVSGKREAQFGGFRNSWYDVIALGRVVTNNLTWVVRNTTVYWEAKGKMWLDCSRKTCDFDVAAQVRFYLEDRFDLRPGKGRSTAYNMATFILGGIWHDLLGSPDQWRHVADWDERLVVLYGKAACNGKPLPKSYEDVWFNEP